MKGIGHVFILSQGQLYDTQSPNLIMADFAATLNISEYLIQGVFIFDQLCDYLPFNSGSLINRYKKGDITSDQFCDGIRSYFWQSETSLSNAQIKTSWNKMCEFTDKSRSNVKGILKLVNENPDLLVVVPGLTNEWHNQYNMDQATTTELRGDYVAGKSNDFIVMHSNREGGKGTLNLNELVKIAKTPEGNAILSVTSLHRAIDPKSISGAESYAKIAMNAHTDLPKLIADTLKLRREAAAENAR